MSANLFSLNNKTAFVTGASSGLGRHFALTLAKAGADIIIGARRVDKLQEVAGEIESLGRKVFPIELDVTNVDSITNAVDKAIVAMGQINILVNNAGVIRRGQTLEYTEADWDCILDTNLKGIWLMSQTVAKRMITQNSGGSIINISSIAARRARKNGVLYSLSKAAVSQLTRALSTELVEYNIRVNAIAPGWFVTDITENFLATPEGKEIVARIPQQRTGKKSELEGPLLLLASNASSYMTGGIIAVDGGMTADAM